MDRLFIFKKSIANPIGPDGSSIDIPIYIQNAFPIRLVRALRILIEFEPNGSNNEIKKFLIVIEFSGTDIGGENPEEVIALAQLKIIKKDYIEKFLEHYSNISENLAGDSPVFELEYKEDEDFNPTS